MSWYVASSLEQLLGEVNASAPWRSKASDGSIGDESHSSRESDHNPCDCHRAVCARDFTHDPGNGFDAHAFADWLRTRCDNGTEGRVKYIISNKRIASPEQDWTWRTYTGSNPHTQHVHVSVDHPSALFDDDSSWHWEGDDDVALSDDDIRRIWSFLIYDDTEGDSPPASQMLRRIRKDTDAIDERTWNVKIYDDTEGDSPPASQMLRRIRKETKADD